MNLRIFALAMCISGIAALPANSGPRSAAAISWGSFAITSGPPPTGTLGIAYGGTHVASNRESYIGFPLNATGGVPPYTWSWAAGRGSSLPPGLMVTVITLGGSTRCCVSVVVISGTPAKAGAYRVVVTVTDSESPAVHASANYTIMISDAAEAIAAPFIEPNASHEYHHYKLTDLGTFGGPSSIVSVEPGQSVINSNGTIVGGADTSVPTPEPACFNPVNNPDCFISHAFTWSGNTLMDLGTLPGGNYSFASGINQSGLIGGTSENSLTDPATGDPFFHAVLWQNAKIQDMGTLGGALSAAFGLNDLGQLTGVALNSAPDPYSILGGGSPTTQTQTRGFLWQNGKMQDLGSLGGPDTWAVFINDSGQIAGASFTSDAIDPNTGTPPVGVFLWQNAKMKDLGNLGGDNGFLGLPGIVNGLNNRGEVIGGMMVPSNQAEHAFLWNGQKLLDLGALGGNGSLARGINDAGEVTGLATLPGDQVNHGFLWRNGVMTDLGTLNGDPCSDALAVSSAGQVVGASQSLGGGCAEWTTAFLWENGGPSVDLNSLVTSDSGARLNVGIWVNGSGEIVAGGIPPGCDDLETCGHIYLLIPCDENHPGIEGCNYSLVDAATAAELRPAEIAKPQGVPASQTKLTPAGMMARFHSAVANRSRWLGPAPPR
jgi:probable HAF family extracellular repeat protein